MSVASTIQPSAARLTGSLRDIGYDFPAAVADLVDNSIAAGASEISVELVFHEDGPYVLIADNGCGMNETELLEALRFGSRRNYDHNELGRFGLGLKTGSFSQCKRLTVVTRTAPRRPVHLIRTLDLDFIARDDSWSVLAGEQSHATDHAQEFLADAPGSVIVWENLDRALPQRYAQSGWTKRRLTSLAKKTGEHLGLVFHRFLAGTHGLTQICMTVNGTKLSPWDPFATEEPHTQALPPQEFELDSGSSPVTFTGYVLPSRQNFSSPEKFEAMSGPLKWNRQQGLYIYRANRLVQFGGWNGLRGIDEHTKLARAALDFDTDLDEVFQINVAKMSVVLPAILKNMLERPVHDLCVRADAAYRHSANFSERSSSDSKPSNADGVNLRDLGVALKGALYESSELEQFEETLKTLRLRHGALAKQLGL